MKVEARLEVEGDCAMLSYYDEVPAEGVAMRHDGKTPMRLYINGVDVGYVTEWPQTDMTMIRDEGGVPVTAVAGWTTIEVVLELGGTDG